MGRRQTTLHGDEPVARFALRLREVRSAANLTLRQLAQRSGYAHSTLATAEAGKTLPSWFVVEAFVQACNADPTNFQVMWNEICGAEAAPRRPLRAVPLSHHDAAPAVPAQLPQECPRLSGRSADVRRLMQMTAVPVKSACAAPTQVVVIEGSAGIGKTELALHFAHQVLDRYVDGHLYVDLRAFDPRHPALSPGEALDHLLASIGFDVDSLPDDIDQKAARYRTAFAGRRSIIMLDNAVSADQLRPLLPGHSSSLVLITSRNELPGLGVRNNAHRLGLDVLQPADSVDLLRHALGDSAGRDETAAIQQLARMCGHLPLALRIAAHRIVGNPMFTVSSFARELAQASDRLSWLKVSADQASDMRASLEQSYRALDAGAAEMFRLLASDNTSVISVESAAILAGTHPETGRRLLESLADAHMVERVAPWQYRFQHLLRIFGRTAAPRTGRTT